MNKTILSLSVATALLITGCGGGSSSKSEPITKSTISEGKITDSNLALGILNMRAQNIDFEFTLSKSQHNQITKIEKNVYGVEPYIDNDDVSILRINESLDFSISTPGDNKLKIVSLDPNTKESVSNTVERNFQSAIEKSAQYALVVYSDFDSEQKSSKIKTDIIKLDNNLNDETPIEIDIFNFTKLDNISYRVSCSSGSSIDIKAENENSHETVACPSGQDLASVSLLNKGTTLTFGYSYLPGVKYSLIIGQDKEGQVISQLVNKETF